LHYEMTVARSDIDPTGSYRFTVSRFYDRDPGTAAEHVGELRFDVRAPVQNSHDRGRKLGRQAAEKFGKRLHAADGCADREDGSSHALPVDDPARRLCRFGLRTHGSARRSDSVAIA